MISLSALSAKEEGISMSTKSKSIFIGSIAFTVFAMFRFCLPVRNMVFYVIACAVFLIVTLLSYIILAGKTRNSSPFGIKVFSILPVAALCIWMVLFYINELKAEHPLHKEDLIRHQFPLALWLALMTIGVAICLFIMRREPSDKTLKIRKKIRAISAVLFATVTSVQFYAPNIFQDVQGGTYHNHAYTNSIINTCWLIPYSHNMETLYGHYGILYMPILKFLHKFLHIDYLTGIFIVTAVIAGISILLFTYVLDYFAKNDLIFYLAMFAIGEEYFMIMQGGVYLQVHPHRMIFPILLTALALFEYKTQKKHHILAVLILTLSLVWSTEVGIVTMLSFALYRWAELAMDGLSFSVRKLALLLRELILYAVLPFALSYIIVCGYNLLAGETILDFREFMYPLISDRDYIDNIELALPDVTHAWIGSSILFLCAICPALFRIFFPNAEKKAINPLYFLLGIMSLGLMLYYINRPVEGCIFITMFLMLILQAAILQKGQDIYLEWKAEKESALAKPNEFLFLSLRVITTLILFIMAFDCIYSIPGALKTSSETVWKRDELMEFAEYVYVQVPPDAVSFGEGVPELMSLIDRDTHLHTTEWSYLNMPLDTMKEIRHDLEDEQWFFCSLASLDYMQQNYPGLTDHFVLHEVFEYNGVQFAFFRKE